jgi:hypothetical protein
LRFGNGSITLVIVDAFALPDTRRHEATDRQSVHHCDKALHPTDAERRGWIEKLCFPIESEANLSAFSQRRVPTESSPISFPRSQATRPGCESRDLIRLGTADWVMERLSVGHGRRSIHGEALCALEFARRFAKAEVTVH